MEARWEELLLEHSLGVGAKRACSYPSTQYLFHPQIGLKHLPFLASPSVEQASSDRYT
jgi:hypothetical protein